MLPLVPLLLTGGIAVLTYTLGKKAGAGAAPAPSPGPQPAPIIPPMPMPPAPNPNGGQGPLPVPPEPLPHEEPQAIAGAMGRGFFPYHAINTRRHAQAFATPWGQQTRYRGRRFPY